MAKVIRDILRNRAAELKSTDTQEYRYKYFQGNIYKIARSNEPLHLDCLLIKASSYTEAFVAFYDYLNIYARKYNYYDGLFDMAMDIYSEIVEDEFDCCADLFGGPARDWAKRYAS